MTWVDDLVRVERDWFSVKQESLKEILKRDRKSVTAFDDAETLTAESPAPRLRQQPSVRGV